MNIENLIDIEEEYSADDSMSETTVAPFELSEEEYTTLELTIHEMLYEKFGCDILTFSKPDFHTNLVNEITELLFESWKENGICNDDDYEDVHENVFSCIDTFFEMHENIIPPRSSFGTTTDIFSAASPSDEINNQIEIVRNAYQPPQRTLEWYEYRHNLMTASNLWKIFSSDAQRNSLIYEKCKPFDPFQSDKTNWHAGGALHWGTVYETVSIQLYEIMYHTTVEDFGCIQHPEYSCIGASPDGINVDPLSNRYGRMIEVKNIVNREITGIPKEEYWIQMQLQMETCNLNECDFIETRFKEYDSEEDFYNDQIKDSDSGSDIHKWRGVILCFVERNVPNSKPTYKYMPLDVPVDKKTVDCWIYNIKHEVREQLVLYTAKYWYLDEFSCVLVRRNRLWFEAALPKILDTWDTILKERETGYEHRMAKKRDTTIEKQTIVSNKDNNYIIHNLPSTNNVCLIKLDGM
jgi:putative phage-type endonuclease